MAGYLEAQFVTEDDLVSDVIRYLSNAPCSHVDIVLPDGSLLGARFNGGVRIRPAGYRKFTYLKRVRVLVPDLEKSLSFARAQIGKPYNWSAIIDMGLHRRRKFSMDQESWFCDELLYATAMAGGLDLLDTSNPLNLTPYEVMLSPYWRDVPVAD